MTWTLSQYRAGDLVEVRSREEILATLDENGCYEGMPFMPEMLEYCGQRIRVRAVAHKTCETARKTWQGRRLSRTVHLADLRCNGSAHGGCEAACTLFWKDAWLTPAGNDVGPSRVVIQPPVAASPCSESQLLSSTLVPGNADDEEPCYSCQATNLYDATTPLAWWDLRQYVLDVVTRNRSLVRMLKVTWLATLRTLVNCVQRIPMVRGVCWRVSEWMHRLLTGRGSPSVSGKVSSGDKTPTGRLDLRPGELVRVKPKAEIELTLDTNARNRGLSFDPREMAPYCGSVYRVRSCVTKILDELTGKMQYMKQPCIILEGVVCRSEYSFCRLNCPRAIPCYWRELWLERVDVDDSCPAVDVNHRMTEQFETTG
jgi:hypothetical protein